MFWHFLRFMFKVTLPTFYKRLQIKNKQNVKVNGPVLIAMNHPNSFMDPIAFSAMAYPPRVMYLARGDAFKEGFVTYVLESIGIVPIFRIQDAGREGLKKNDETFKRVNFLLGRNRKIIVFAEGLCVSERRLRSLKKGPARMVFGAMEAINNPDLIVLPVGANYSKPEKFRSDLYFEVGEPIRVADYMEAYKENPARTLTNFTAMLESKMKELIVHIDEKENDLLIEELQPIYKYQFLEESKLDAEILQNHQVYWKFIVSRINELTKRELSLVEELRAVTHEYTQVLRKNKLRDHLIYNDSKPYNLSLEVIKMILGFPFYIIGKILNFVPYSLSLFIANKTVKEIEFHSAVNMVAGSFVFLFYFIAEILILWLVVKSWIIAAIYFGCKILCGWFGLHFRTYWRKVLGKVRLEGIKKNNKELYISLLNKRNRIIEIIKTTS